MSISVAICLGILVLCVVFDLALRLLDRACGDRALWDDEGEE
jgi:hypothetical protein